MNKDSSDCPGNFFEAAYRARPPWDIGKPQLDMLAVCLGRFLTRSTRGDVHSCDCASSD